MTQIIVTINSKRVELDLTDLDEATPRIFKRQIDPENLATALGDLTLSLKLPKTSRNVEAFEHTNLLEVQNSILKLVTLDAQIIVDGFTVLEGKMVLDKISEDFFEVQILGENIAWKNLFQNKKLPELTGFEKFRFTGARGDYNDPWIGFFPSWSERISVVDLWTRDQEFEMQFLPILYRPAGFPSGQANLEPDADGKNIPIADFNDKYESAIFQTKSNLQDLLIGETEGYSLTPHLMRTREFTWKMEDFTPAVFLKSIIRNIFKEIGYSVNGTFMEDSETDNLILPFYGTNDEFLDCFNWGTLGYHSSSGQVDLVTSDRTDGVVEPDAENELWHPDTFGEDQGGMVGWPNCPREVRLEYSSGTSPYIGRLSNFNLDPFYSYNWDLDVRNYFDRPIVALQPALFWRYRSYATSTRKDNVSLRDKFGFSDNFFYEVKNDGKYRIEISYRIENDSASLDPINTRLVFGKGIVSSSAPPDYILNEQLDTVPQNTLLESSKQVLNPGQSRTIILDEVVELKRGELIRPDLWATTNSSTDGFTIIYRMNSLFISPIEQEEFLDPAKCLPNIKIQEFLKDIIKIFNLQITTRGTSVSLDYNQGLSLGTFPSVATSWTDKTDINKAEIKITAGQKNFEFTNNGEDLAGIENNEDYFWASQYQRPDVELEEFEIPYLPTTIREMKTQTEDLDTNPVVNDNAFGRFENNITTPLVITGTLGDWETKQKIAAISPLERDTKTILRWRGTFNFPGNRPAWLGAGIHGQQVEEQTNSAKAGNSIFPWVEPFDLLPETIFENYYESYLKSLERTLQVILPIYLEAKDLDKIDLRIPVEIDGQLYRIAEISGFNPAKVGTTKVKLLRI